ncbi:MAG: hypothetical protein K2X31_03980, partial [Sphingopyxis sp.]|nr:hypothetical protein [Sphingopyxis sp.]
MPTNDEIRLANLQRLRDLTGSRTWRELADRCETSEAYLSQIANRLPDSKSGKPKAVGDRLARKLEVGMQVARGWMDQEHQPTPFEEGFQAAIAVEQPRPPTALEQSALNALRGLTIEQQQEAIAAMERTREANRRIVTELSGSAIAPQATPNPAAEPPPSPYERPPLRPY